MDDFFDEGIHHEKGAVERIKESDTSRMFGSSGTPFIAGASGTVQIVAMIMEVGGKFQDLSKEEKDQREIILGLIAAAGVVGGNHSMMESILAAKLYGYFAQVPDSLESARGYDRAIAALENRLNELGLSAVN
jgi:hypothetical protein